MKRIILIILFYICFAFSSANAQEQNKLETYFNKNQINQINDYLKGFKNIKTAHDLHRVYQKIIEISGSLADSLEVKVQSTEDWSLDYDLLDTIVPGISFAGYEGTAVIVSPNLSIFIDLAESTPEKSDDDFFEILFSVYGEDFFPAWIEQTSDYSGVSLLGDDIELNTLKKIQNSLIIDKEFEPELNKLKKDIINDITHGNCYNYNSQKIIAEINKIITSIKLTEVETKMLKKRIDEFKNPAKGLKIDCENNDCDCGG